MFCAGLGVGEFVLELFYPRFKLVDQVLERLHGVIANWWHVELIARTKT
jgi:hypothetical protein